jgi:hypothetical protein
MDHDSEPEGPHATIHIIQTGAPRDCPPSPAFAEVDGRCLGPLDRETYVTAYVPAGEHHAGVRYETAHEGKRLSVEAGKTYFLRVDTHKQSWGYIVLSKRVKEEEGARLVQEYCRLGAVDLTKESGQGK